MRKNRGEKKRSMRPQISLSSLLIVLILFSVLSLAVMNFLDSSEYYTADVLEVEGSVVTIGHGCMAIVAETSPERAYSIELGIKGVIEQRPNTHDIFSETMKSFNITLDHVTIDNHKDGIYYANLLLKSNEKILKLDVKPSDGIAMALRSNATIYINKTMLQEVGVNIC
ncbi:MAG: bifunctional nuclease family protein [Candidatus Aenigmatarchaeota archaeon]